MIEAGLIFLRSGKYFIKLFKYQNYFSQNVIHSLYITLFQYTAYFAEYFKYINDTLVGIKN